jgi:hypothetical protein
MTSLGGGAIATSSARRPSGRMSGVPQRLQDITVPNSDHFQHVGQQTFMTTAHSQTANGVKSGLVHGRCRDRDRFSAARL